MRTLALNKDGKITYCVAPPEMRGKGKCNHISHINENETKEDFMSRINLRNKLVSFEITENELKDSLMNDGVQNKYYIDGFYVKEDLDTYEKKQRNALSEELISLFLNFTDIDHANYDCIKMNDKTVCISRDIKPKNKEMFGLASLLDEEIGTACIMGESNDLTPNLNLLCAAIKQKTNLDIKTHILRTISLDIITLNGDRHLENISLFHDMESGEWNLAPLYDNGEALFSDKSFDDCDDMNFWDKEEMESPSTFGIGPMDDYIDLVTNNLSAKNAIRVDYDKAVKAINNYSNDYYETKFVERAKSMLIQRLDDFENVLWIRKEGKL